MIDPTPLPGLAGHTVVVIGAGDAIGTATTLTLLASGATVLATDASTSLPASLVDAGTGLPGEVHYRPLDASSDADWSGLADWIGEQAAGVHGIADHASGDLRPDHGHLAALVPHLLEGASIVRIGRAPTGGSSIRSSVVTHHADADPLAVAAAAAFLLSDLAEFIDGAVVPVEQRPAPAI